MSFLNLCVSHDIFCIRSAVGYTSEHSCDCLPMAGKTFAWPEMMKNSFKKLKSRKIPRHPGHSF